MASSSKFGPNKLSNLQVKAIRRERAKGTALSVLAEEHSVTRAAIAYHCTDIKVDARSLRRTKATRIDPDAILLMVGHGYSQSAIARHFGVSPGAINKALARMEWKAAA